MAQNDPGYVSYVHTCPACGLLVANMSRVCHRCGCDQPNGRLAVGESESGNDLEALRAESRKAALLAMTLGAAFAKVAALRGDSS